MGAEAFKIRELSHEDIAAIIEMDAEIFHEQWNVHIWLDELQNSLGRYLVLECDGTPVAYAGYWAVAGEAQITRVGVAKSAQGKGLGARVFAALLKDARENGMTSVTLEVRSGNAPALGMYKKFGFVAVGRRRGYYADNHEDAILMTLLLTPVQH